MNGNYSNLIIKELFTLTLSHFIEILLMSEYLTGNEYKEFINIKTIWW